jgi:hypothetical protein
VTALRFRDAVNYVALALRLAASAFAAIITVSLLPPFWTFTSMAARRNHHMGVCFCIAS